MKLNFVFITENQKSFNKAKKLTNLIQKSLDGNIALIVINKYDTSGHKMELIFNRNEYSKFLIPSFNIIIWAHCYY